MMKQYTYTIYKQSGEKKKTVTCTSNDNVGRALETFMKPSLIPPYEIEELKITIDKIEEIER